MPGQISTKTWATVFHERKQEVPRPWGDIFKERVRIVGTGVTERERRGNRGSSGGLHPLYSSGVMPDSNIHFKMSPFVLDKYWIKIVTLTFRCVVSSRSLIKAILGQMLCPARPQSLGLTRTRR